MSLGQYFDFLFPWNHSSPPKFHKNLKFQPKNVEKNDFFPSQMMIETFFSVNEQSTNERWVFRGSASTLVSLLFHSPLAKTQKTQNKIFSGEKIGGENLKLKIHNEKTGLNRFRENIEE